jgi:hypothetical protein
MEMLLSKALEVNGSAPHALEALVAESSERR